MIRSQQRPSLWFLGLLVLNLAALPALASDLPKETDTRGGGSSGTRGGDIPPEKYWEAQDQAAGLLAGGGSSGTRGGPNGGLAALVELMTENHEMIEVIDDRCTVPWVGRETERLLDLDLPEKLEKFAFHLQTERLVEMFENSEEQLELARELHESCRNDPDGCGNIELVLRALEGNHEALLPYFGTEDQHNFSAQRAAHLADYLVVGNYIWLRYLAEVCLIPAEELVP